MFTSYIFSWLEQDISAHKYFEVCKLKLIMIDYLNGNGKADDGWLKCSASLFIPRELNICIALTDLWCINAPVQYVIRCIYVYSVSLWSEVNNIVRSNIWCSALCLALKFVELSAFCWLAQWKTFVQCCRGSFPQYWGVEYFFGLFFPLLLAQSAQLALHCTPSTVQSVQYWSVQEHCWDSIAQHSTVRVGVLPDIKVAVWK